MQMASSVGAATGCVFAAVFGGAAGAPDGAKRGWLCVASLVAMVLFYQQGRFYEGGVPPYNAALFVLWAGVGKLVSAAFYGWPLYLRNCFRPRFARRVRVSGTTSGVIAAVGQ